MASALGLLIAILANPISDILGDVGLSRRTLVGVFLFLCAPAFALELRREGIQVTGIAKWGLLGLAGLGASIALSGIFELDVPPQFWFGILLMLCAPTLALGLGKSKPSVQGFVRWGIMECFAVGTILALTGALGLGATTTATCAVLASLIVWIVATRKGWVSISFRAPAFLQRCFDRCIRQARVALRRLTRFFLVALSSRMARAALWLVAFVALVVIILLLQDQIRTAFDAFVSLARIIRQGAKENEDQVVFAALGLASVAVLSAVLITIVYEKYSRRLTAVVLAIAFLALATLFCTYTAPEIVIQADRVVNPPTATPIPTETVTPTPTPVASVIATLAKEVEESPTSAVTEEPTDVIRTPIPKLPSTTAPELTPIATSLTPTRIQPSLTPTSTPVVTVPTPTRIQPTSVPPTSVPTPTRVQPKSTAKPRPTPTRIQPKSSYPMQYLDTDMSRHES